jgi:hypothetical protein
MAQPSIASYGILQLFDTTHMHPHNHKPALLSEALFSRVESLP